MKHPLFFVICIASSCIYFSCTKDDVRPDPAERPMIEQPADAVDSEHALANFEFSTPNKIGSESAGASIFVSKPLVIKAEGHSFSQMEDGVYSEEGEYSGLINATTSCVIKVRMSKSSVIEGEIDIFTNAGNLFLLDVADTPGGVYSTVIAGTGIYKGVKGYLMRNKESINKVESEPGFESLVFKGRYLPGH